MRNPLPHQNDESLCFFPESRRVKKALDSKKVRVGFTKHGLGLLSLRTNALFYFELKLRQYSDVACCKLSYQPLRKATHARIV